jgi:hypothetical protein
MPVAEKHQSDRIGPSGRERLSVGFLSLAATWLFFVEYLPPFKRVHFPYDIEGFHYPLLDYAFRSLREGRLPLWDPSMYCGIPLAANIQAALFYPPHWLLFLLDVRQRVLPYTHFEALVAAHIWLAFFLAYLWLRGRFSTLPSVLAAAVYGFSGYALSQIQHAGVIEGYAWAPLAMWGIDQAAQRRNWRPLWKVAAASALCLLAGFPSTWVVLCFSIMAYATASLRLRVFLGAAGALAVSLLLAAVQLLPAVQASALKTFDPKYGNGIQNLEFYVAYFIPNYFKLGADAAGWGSPSGQYLWLGAPGLFGLCCLIRPGKLRPYLPVLAIGGVLAIMLGNPFNFTTRILEQSRLAIQVVRSFNFLEEIPLAATILAAIGMERFLAGKPRRKIPGWGLAIGLFLVIVFLVRQLYVSLPGGPDFASRWRGLIEAGLTLGCFVFLLTALRGSIGRRRVWLTVALLFLVWTDYKVYGTSRGFNSVVGISDPLYMGQSPQGIDPVAYRTILANPGFRTALDENAAPFTTDMRHWGLTSPQGFDPFLTVQYKSFVEEDTPFQTDRLFYLDPSKPRLLDLVGVRYFITREGGARYEAIRSSPLFRLVGPEATFYRVYEYLKATPSFRWESPKGAGQIQTILWTPEKRGFHLRAEAAGRFVLAEQLFPGWRATVDGQPVRIEPWQKAFQSVPVQAGEHVVRFEYRPASLEIGAAISLLALAALLLVPRLLPKLGPRRG